MTDEPNTEDKDRLISLAEAAEMYDFNADHLRHMAQKERMKAQKVGNYWVTTPKDVEEYIRSRKQMGAYRKDIQLDD